MNTSVFSMYKKGSLVMKVLVLLFTLLSLPAFAQTVPTTPLQSNCAHLEMSQELAKRATVALEREERKQARTELSRVRQCLERELMRELHHGGKQDRAKAHFVAEAAFTAAISASLDTESQYLECNYLIIALQHEQHQEALKRFEKKNCSWGLYERPKWISQPSEK